MKNEVIVTQRSVWDRSIALVGARLVVVQSRKELESAIYFGNMSQMQIVRFDPKTGKMETFKPPIPESALGDGHLTMIDPAFQHVDGKLWVNVAFATGEAGGTWHVDLATNTWTRVAYPPGSPSALAYDVVADSKNNMYGMQMGNDKIWITNGKTLQTAWYDFPTKGAGCRRGHIDSQDRLWCGVFNGNRLAMFDPRTQKISEWKVPTQWTRPYDAQFDDKTYAWTAGMDNDLAVRLNPQTGEFTEYLLPHETNVMWRCRNPGRSPAYGWETSTARPLSISSRWRRKGEAAFGRRRSVSIS